MAASDPSSDPPSSKSIPPIAGRRPPQMPATTPDPPPSSSQSRAPLLDYAMAAPTNPQRPPELRPLVLPHPIDLSMSPTLILRPGLVLPSAIPDIEPPPVAAPQRSPVRLMRVPHCDQVDLASPNDHLVELRMRPIHVVADPSDLHPLSAFYTSFRVKATSLFESAVARHLSSINCLNSRTDTATHGCRRVCSSFSPTLRGFGMRGLTVDRDRGSRRRDTESWTGSGPQSCRQLDKRIERCRLVARPAGRRAGDRARKERKRR